MRIFKSLVITLSILLLGSTVSALASIKNEQKSNLNIEQLNGMDE